MTDRFAATATKPAENVSRLIVLPFRKSVEISLKSLRVRFLRNLVTVLTLVLAVSFLAFILATADLAGGMLHSGDPAMRQKLVRAGYDITEATTDIAGSAKERWIVILSLLVCTVGIVNAQLMSVTERFREIGTMKCLGALDSFILRLFLLEAGFQGVAGGLAGGLLGGLVAVLFGMARYGVAAALHLEADAVLRSMALSAATGLLLSLVGVLYPAIVAARMQPVEAMRAEQ